MVTLNKITGCEVKKMADYWQGFFTGLLFFCAILNLITVIHYRIKINKIDELLTNTQKIYDQLIEANRKG